MSIDKKNLTERAAAVKYSGIGAPRVVAKGEGEVALNIEAVAREHEVPLVDDAILASMLVNVPLGDEIPENLYYAVAEVLAHIYRLNESIDKYL